MGYCIYGVSHTWVYVKSKLIRESRLNTINRWYPKYLVGRMFSNYVGSCIGSPQRTILHLWVRLFELHIFASAKSTLAGVSLTYALCENKQIPSQIMFTSCAFNSAIVWYFPYRFAQVYLRAIHYQWLWLNRCTSYSVGDIDAIQWGNACCGPNGTSAWPRSLQGSSSHAWGGDP